MSKLIPLTQDKFTIVDNEDYKWLSCWKWYASFQQGIWYAMRADYFKGQRKRIYMHRIILNVPEGMVTDHINGDGLDNRKENLRKANASLNQHNRHKLKSNKTSKYRGICWDKIAQKWLARIMFNHKRKYLGCFDSEKKAAEIYNDATSLIIARLLKNSGE